MQSGNTVVLALILGAMIGSTWAVP